MLPLLLLAAGGALEAGEDAGAPNENDGAAAAGATEGLEPNEKVVVVGGAAEPPKENALTAGEEAGAAQELVGFELLFAVAATAAGASTVSDPSPPSDNCRFSACSWYSFIK